MPSTRRRSVVLIACCVALAVYLGSLGTALAVGPATSPGTADADAGTAVNVTVQRAPGHLPPGEAVAAAETNASVRPDDWLVLTVNVGDVLDDVDRSTTLDAATGGTQHVTLGIRQTNPRPERPAHRIHPRNLTRMVDTENGTITYVYDGETPGQNPSDPIYRVNLTVAAANPHVRSRQQVTREFELRTPELEIGPEGFSNFNDVGTDVLPPESDVRVPVDGRFAAGKPLEVAVRASGTDRVLDRQSITMSAKGTTNATLDLSSVAVGSRVVLTVSDGHTGRLIGYQRATVDRKPVVQLHRVHQPEGLPRTGTGSVLVTVANVGTASFDGQVTATFSGQTFRTNATVAPGVVRNVSLQLRTDDSAVGNHQLALEAGGARATEEIYVGMPILESLDLEKYDTTDSETVVWRGTNLTVEVRLANPSTGQVTESLVVWAGNYTAERTVRLDPVSWNETHVTVPTDQFAPGDHEVTVEAGDDTGTLRLDVQPAVDTATDDNETVTASPTPGTDGPGFTAVATLLALPSLVVLVRYRKAAG